MDIAANEPVRNALLEARDVVRLEIKEVWDRRRDFHPAMADEPCWDSLWAKATRELG